MGISNYSYGHAPVGDILANPLCHPEKYICGARPTKVYTPYSMLFLVLCTPILLLFSSCRCSYWYYCYCCLHVATSTSCGSCSCGSYLLQPRLRLLLQVLLLLLLLYYFYLCFYICFCYYDYLIRYLLLQVKSNCPDMSVRVAVTSRFHKRCQYVFVRLGSGAGNFGPPGRREA